MSHDEITIQNIIGEDVTVPRSSLIFRPSAYGIAVRDGAMLLCTTKSTGKYCLPGGGIDPGESGIDALRREMREECGVEIDSVAPITFAESLFFDRHHQKPWQVFALIYRCTITGKTTETRTWDETEEMGEGLWIPIADLRKEDFQVFGDIVIEILSKKNLVHVQIRNSQRLRQHERSRIAPGSV